MQDKTYERYEIRHKIKYKSNICERCRQVRNHAALASLNRTWPPQAKPWPAMAGHGWPRPAIASPGRPLPDMADHGQPLPARERMLILAHLDAPRRNIRWRLRKKSRQKLSLPGNTLSPRTEAEPRSSHSYFRNFVAQ